MAEHGWCAAGSTELGALVDPHAQSYTKPIDLSGFDGAEARRFLRQLVLVRVVEETIAEMIENGDVHCPCHLAIGQEAAAVGIAAHLSKTDRVFGNHRSHAHYLALGGSVYRLLAEILGKADGCAGGFGGSMHIRAEDVGFMGSVPIVAATIPLAVGAALAARMDGGRDIALTFFGDGAAEEGVFHESLNLAVSLHLPVLFVCENNLYSSHLDIAIRQPSDRIARFAEAHHVPARVVDGNDVCAVARAAGELTEGMRAGNGPAFLEAVAFRWRGHVGPDENIDVGVRRSAELIAAWKGRDAIARLAQAMRGSGWLEGDDALDRLHDKVRAAVAADRSRALDAPWPAERAVLDNVYAEGATR